jgi:hypothetical protein
LRFGVPHQRRRVEENRELRQDRIWGGGSLQTNRFTQTGKALAFFRLECILSNGKIPRKSFLCIAQQMFLYS